MIRKYWFITVLLITSGVVLSHADESPIAQIQAQVDALIEENAKLEAEYKLLKENAESLERTITEQDKKAKDLEKQTEQDTETKEAREKSLAELQEKIEELQSNLTVQRQIKARLQNESSQIDQNIKALQKQLTNIPEGKESLSKEIKFRQFAYEQAKERKALELKDLKTSLNKLENREQQLLAFLKKVKNVPTSKEAIQEVKRENQALQKQIKELKKEINVKTKANTKLKQKISSSSQLAAKELLDKEKERVALNQSVEKLQLQLDAFNQNLDAYIADQTKREGLLQEIMQFNEENEALRQKISPTP